jgi:uncharacterized protein involved in exopolysaccharide biosynthesis
VEIRRKQSVVRKVESEAHLEFVVPPKFVDAEEEDKAFDIARWQLLWDNRQWLGRVALRALVISTLIAFLIPRRFESTAKIMPPESLNGNTNMLTAMLGSKSSPALAAMAGNILGSKSTGALFAELLKSRTVQDHIVQRFELQKVYWERYEEDARKVLEKRTDITEDRKSGVISVAVTDRIPQRAQEIAQSYVEELNRLVSQVSTSSARRERMFIEQRLTGVKSDLEDAEREFGAFASANTALDVKEQTKAMVESAAQIQGQLIAAQSELQGLEQIYTANNVRVRAARARIDELNRQLAKFSGSDTSPEKAGDASADELYPTIRKLPLLGVKWADLYRRVKVQETVFELLHQQYELARIQEAKEIPTVNVIDPANYPEKKSFPPRLAIIALGFTLSFAGACAWLIVAEKWQQINPDDPRKALATEVGSELVLRAKEVARWPLVSRLRSLHRRDNHDHIADE